MTMHVVTYYCMAFKNSSAEEKAKAAAYMRDYRQRNLEKMREAGRRKREREYADPVKRERILAANRRWEAKVGGNRRKFYGIGREEFERMVAAQNGLCAICSKVMGSGKGGTSLDHCHATGKIRGLLCMNCNQGIGRFKESIDALESAIRYLKHHS